MWAPHSRWAVDVAPVRSAPLGVQSQMLRAAAATIELLENRTLRGRTHARLFPPAPPAPVHDNRPPSAAPRDPYMRPWDLVRATTEEAVRAAREDPTVAQALYDTPAMGCRTSETIARLLAELGIPTATLSHKHVETTRPHDIECETAYVTELGLEAPGFDGVT